MVTAYLDFAELRAQNRHPMHMKDWIAKLDGFLSLSQRNILTNAGKVSHQLALEHAEKEFDKYGAERRTVEASEPVSDFDKLVVKKVKELGPAKSDEPKKEGSKTGAKKPGRKS